MNINQEALLRAIQNVKREMPAGVSNPGDSTYRRLPRTMQDAWDALGLPTRLLREPLSDIRGAMAEVMNRQPGEAA